MPGRNIPLVTGEIYHIVNRGIASQPTFLNKRNYHRAIETLFYYQYINFPVKYSRFLSLSTDLREQISKELIRKKQHFIKILAYCLMPNHFHLILEQYVDRGISKFMSNFTNSYTRYFNTRNERDGPLFKDKFKAIRIETDEQLLHVSRYIHLNPYTAYIIKTLRELEDYPYSSFPEYIGKISAEICSKDYILGNFKDKSAYKKFVLDQAEYQRELGKIKHLILE